jgi:hypothetical protein
MQYFYEGIWSKIGKWFQFGDNQPILPNSVTSQTNAYLCCCLQPDLNTCGTCMRCGGVMRTGQQLSVRS